MHPAEAAVPYSGRPTQTETNTAHREARHRVARTAARWGVPIVLLAAALGGVIRWQAARRAPAIHFDVATIDRGNISAKVSATGAVSALVTVSVGSQVSG